jgi:ankyrin repeat protein
MDILINENKWNILYNKIKNGEYDPNKQLIGGYTVVHIGVVRNQLDFITEMLSSNYKNLFTKADGEGNTAVHLATKFKNIDIFKLIVRKIPETINMLNNLHHTPIWYLINEPDVLLWITQNVPTAIFEIVDYKNNSFIEKVIKLVESPNDKYFKLLDKIINKEIYQLPDSEPILIFASKQGIIELVKMFLDKGIDVNQKNKYQETALNHALYFKHNDIVKLLITHGADVNHRGVDGKNNPIGYCIKTQNYEMIEYLLQNNYNPNNQDMMLYTDMHHILIKQDIPLELVFKMIYYSDMNIQNINGDTPLHLLLKLFNWEDFDKVLCVKKLDIYIKNRDSKTPLSFVPKKQLQSFYQLVTISYLYQLQEISVPDKLTNQLDKRCNSKSSTIQEQCERLIKSHIIKDKCSIPELRDDLIYELKMIKNKQHYVNYGKFNADYTNSIIYSVCLMEKYPQLCFPFQYYDQTINATDNNNRCFINYNEPYGYLILDVMDIFYYTLYELSPAIIIWRNRWINYFHPRLKLNLLKLLLSPKVRFIYLKLTLAVSTSIVHANGILYDKQTKILERFEPYGTLHIYDGDLLNQKILDIFQQLVPEKIQFITPNDYLQDIGFQTVSNDSALHVKKLGDPEGYCLAWTLWYLEIRMLNPDIHPKILIKKVFDKIINQKNKSNDELSFINFIRDYSHNLDSMKNDFLKKQKIKSNDYYSMIYTQDQREKIAIGLVNSMTKIINQRIGF